LCHYSIICAFVSQILQALEPVALAPAWFAAFQQQLQAQLQATQAQQQAALAAIQANHGILLETIVNAPIKRCNFSSMSPESAVYPLEVNGAVPANFPVNRAALLQLPGPALNQLLAFYGLNQQGVLAARRQLLNTFLGLR
jgi:hypothetical protein